MVELAGAEIRWINDWYDGPIDGLAAHGDQVLWFSVDWSTDWLAERPRRYLAFRLHQEEFDAAAAAAATYPEVGSSRRAAALGEAWDYEDVVGLRPIDRHPVGWFRA